MFDAEFREATNLGRQETYSRGGGDPSRKSLQTRIRPKHRAFTLAKPLLAGLTYPYDWGLILSTQAEDGDPLDVLVIHDAATYPGLLLRCKPIGVLEVLQTSKDGRKGTTEFSRCLTGHHLRESCRTSGVFQHAQLRSWRNFLKLPMRLKIRNWIFWVGAVQSKRSKRSNDFRVRNQQHVFKAFTRRGDCTAEVEWV